MTDKVILLLQIKIICRFYKNVEMYGFEIFWDALWFTSVEFNNRFLKLEDFDQYKYL